MVNDGCSTGLLEIILVSKFYIIYFKMSFDDNQFSVVLDKGTFDALMSNKSQQVRSIKRKTRSE